jgi:hypothetical protein
MISFEQVVSLDLSPFTFAEHEHLFDWQGQLIAGLGEAIATDDLEAIEATSLSYWKYRSQRIVSTNPLPYPQRVPDISASEMRDRLVAPVEMPQAEESFARPNAAAAFDLLQQQSIHLPNPLLEQWGIASFVQKMTLLIVPESLLAGQLWTFSNVSHAVLGFQLLQPSLITAVGVQPAAKMLYAHLQQNSEQLKSALTKLQLQDLENLKTILARKLDLIEVEQRLWAEACLTPVLNADGEVHEPLCLCNAVTAMLGMQGLQVISKDCFSFVEGAISAASELIALS